MATGTSMLGTRLLDVLSTNSNEVASFGNTTANAYMRVYDNNSPLTTGYVMGLSNSSFALVKSSAPSNTQLAIGTYTPLSSANLHVQGTIATSNLVSYTADKTLNLLGTSLAGVSNLAVSGQFSIAGVPFGTGQWTTSAGTLYTYSNVGIGTLTPRTNFDVRGDSSFLGNVGIGTTIATSNLTVQGNGLISGTLTVGQLIDQSARAGTYNAWYLSGADVTGAKTLFTNDATATNRVLFSFNLLLGQYIISGNIPYKNLTSMISIDNLNWATIGLYQCTPQTFYDALPPLYTVPLVALGNDSTEFDTCSFNTFLQVTTNLGTDYVIAITGKGHQLQIGGTGLPTPIINTIPIRGIGVNDNIAVRQQLQMSPIRNSLTSTAGQQIINTQVSGVYSVDSSNVDVYINGSKYMYRNNATTDYTITTNVVNNMTTFSVNLASPLDAGNEIDVVIWPSVPSSNFYSSGYLYQTINNYSVKWLNVNGGGMRTAERLIVDGDLFVGGNVFFGCNTTVFPSGAVWSGDNTSITSNLIGSVNIVDGAITTSKLLDGSVINSKLAAGSITFDKLAANTITSNVIAANSISVANLNLSSGNVGIGSLVPRGQLDVNGTIYTNTSYVLSSSNQNMSYDFVESSSSLSPLVTFQSTNIKSLPTPTIRIEANSLSNQANGTSVSTWGPYASVGGSSPSYYTSSGWLKGGMVSFVGNLSHTMRTSNAFNFNSTGGFTAIALCRFDTQPPQTVNDGDRVFTLSQTGGNSIYLVRNSANNTLMNLGINFGTPYVFALGSNVITPLEWAVYAVTIPSQSGGSINLYKNGRLVGTQAMPFTLSSTSPYSFDQITLCAGAASTYGNMSFGGLHMYDGVLTPEQLTSVTNYFMQGSANVVGNRRTLLQANPMPYATGDVLTGAPAQSIDVAANFRVRALPSDPLWSIDAYTPTSRFLNTTALPTFSFGQDSSTAGIEITTGTYLTMEPGYYRMGTTGITILLKFRFTTTNFLANETLMYFGVDAVQGSTTNPYILISRDGSTQNIKVTAYKSSTQSSVISSSGISLVQYDINTLAVVIDPAAKGTISIWVNGTLNQTMPNIASSSYGVFQDTFFRNIFIGTSGTTNLNATVYNATVYNRALSATELAQAFTTFGTDTQFASVDMAGRTGKSALAISKEGYVAPFTMSPDNIPGLVAYLPFDNHLFDATIGINCLSTPQVTGNVQFNTKGRVGQSIVCLNPIVSLSGPVTSYITYPFNYTLSSSSMTISVWIRPYSYGGNPSTFLSLGSTYSPTVYAIRLTINSANVLNATYQDTSDTIRGLLSTITPSYNTWCHVALTISSSNGIYMYVNGTLAASYATPVASATLTSLCIGASIYTTTNPVGFGYNGEVDDVRIYNRVLTLAEIQALASVPATSPSLQFNSAGTGVPGVNINTGSAQIMAPLQLSATTTIDTTITDNQNRVSATTLTSQGFQLQDLTGIQQNIQLGPGITTTSNSPFTNNPAEGSFTLPGTTTGFLTFTDAPLYRYGFNWWQNGGFTLEMWVNYSTFTTSSLTNPSSVVMPMLIGLMSTSSVVVYWSFGADTTGALTFYYFNNTTGVAIKKGTPTTMSTNTWHHIAVTCDTTTIRTFLNGTLEASALVSASQPWMLNTVPLTLGYIGTATGGVSASLSSVRLVSGACLYTANFTPSTQPLTVSSTGTNALLLRNSLNAQTPMTITSGGNMTLAGNISAGNLGMFRNRVINGDMRIDQRRSGVAQTSVTATIFAADRTKFEIQGSTSGTYTIQQVTDAPPGFTNSIRATVTTSVASYGAADFSMFTHRIEGYNIADFNLGTSYASPFVVSFWVKASVTGTYGLGIDNDWNGNRGYTTTFTIVNANVWERKVLYIPGETSGTWAADNTVGLRISVSFGNGTNFANTVNNRWTTTANKMLTSGNVALGTTNGATFAMTGLQVEKGTVVTPFEYRPYSTELALCQRYCNRIVAGNTYARFCTGIAISTGQIEAPIQLTTPLRIAPNGTGYLTTSGGSGFLLQPGAIATSSMSLTNLTGSTTTNVLLTASATVTSGSAYTIYANNNANAFIQIDVEL